MIKRLRIKFVCINMTIVTIMLLVIFSMLFCFTLEDLRKQNKQMMEMALQIHQPRDMPEKRPNKMLFPGFVVDVVEQGTLTIRSGGLVEPSDEQLVKELVSLVQSSDKRAGSLPEYSLHYQRHMMEGRERIAFMDMSSETETMKGLIRNGLIVGAVSLAAFLAISIFLANWAVRPVESAWNQQRRFVADASHELKTPLTVIMTNAELLQSGMYPQAEQMQFSRNILTMSGQMRTLVEGMLDLARMDSGTARMSFAKLNFSILVEECLMRFEPVYFEKGKYLEGTLTEGLAVCGSEAHLRQVLDILLDNGAKYADPETTVQVRLTRQGNQCVVQVASCGEQLSDEERRQIFKRFYRVDPARSRDGSYGLGLSIAQGIVAEHHGKIWAESSAGVNTFFVQLNLAR